MVEFEIQASTRQCAISGKELKPGDWVWSVLTDEEGRMVRKDYSVDTWQGPPAGAFSFWKFQIREKASTKETQKLDEIQLQDWFERLEGQEEAKQQNIRYLLGLMLLRKKKLKLLRRKTLATWKKLSFVAQRQGWITKFFTPKFRKVRRFNFRMK
jgi:hypothetical protein